MSDIEVQQAFRALYEAHREAEICREKARILRLDLEQAERDVEEADAIVREKQAKINRLARQSVVSDEDSIPIRPHSEFVPVKR